MTECTKCHKEIPPRVAGGYCRCPHNLGLTPKEAEIVAVMQHRSDDLWGESAERVRAMIDAQYGSPLGELARWNVMLDIVRKLTGEAPNEKLTGPPPK